MFYPENAKSSIDPEVFKNPGAEYRGAPFWAWNNRLNKEQLFFEIDRFREMGMGGFHIHPRGGLLTPYLSDEFMGLVRACVDRARENDMLCWLYDEDRWPSGAAGGFVTKDRSHRMRYLVFTPWPYGSGPTPVHKGELVGAQVLKNGKGTLVARFEVSLENGFLADYHMLDKSESPGDGYRVWYAYLEIAEGRPWYNNQAYVNTLSRDSIERFIALTHERYWEVVGDEFGRTIPAIFTDEPQFAHKQTLGFADEERDLIIPYTDDFEKTYTNAYGEPFLPHLPELFWEMEDHAVSLFRYRYHDHVTERFAEAFVDTVGRWCSQHGIMLTGHMMMEPTLESQTQALGEAMRSYRSFQLPGIDLLCDRIELTTAKQAQSAANQSGAPGVMSELYGVTGWHFDFRRHKLQGDWQAALGVTVRVHHLTLVSMEGEAKRDYPASIGYQAPWFREYRSVEDHFARVNAAMTRGTPLVRIGVVHPIESYWLSWGPREQTALERDEMETNFTNVTNWLLYGQLDFDFLAESLLVDRCRVEGRRLEVGKAAYDVVLVPGCRTIRSSTLRVLEQFHAAGGEIVFVGTSPTLVDAKPSAGPAVLSEGCSRIPFSRSALLGTLEGYREVEVRRADGSLHDNLICRLRRDGERRWLFVSHVRPPENPDLPDVEEVTLRIPGRVTATLFDTLDGSTHRLTVTVHHTSAEHRRSDDGSRAEETSIVHQLAAYDSLLLALDPDTVRPAADSKVERPASDGLNRSRAGRVLHRVVRTRFLEGPAAVELSEPNALLLDRAAYALDGGSWRDSEEILRADNEVRRELEWPLRGGRMAQPWVEPEDASFSHRISFRFVIDSEVDVMNPLLALERAGECRIALNGTDVPTVSNGWFVDTSIATIPLPPMNAGESELVVTVPIGRRSGAEWCYLLGDFGVAVEGAAARLIPAPRTLSFGDWTSQGLPFYAGNMTYRLTFEGAGHFAVQVPQFRNPLLSVRIDERVAGRIAFSPYVLDLGELGGGTHTLEITAFGNRANAFGPVHNANDKLEWQGPPAWRTEGSEWSYEYRLRPTGVLISPRLLELS